jgi:hypothetical protein
MAINDDIYKEWEIDKMKFLDLLNRKVGEYGLFDALIVGDYKLSIQASRTHYCNPKETHVSAHAYSEFELALFDKDWNWLNPITDERFQGIASDLEDHWEKGDVAVGGYIGNDLVQKLYDYCESISN